MAWLGVMPTSAEGPQGEKGDPGERGNKWFSGSGPPTSVPGAEEGDWYIDRETGKVYNLLWG